ncbi:MAG TPA: hypothetical protein VGO04_03455 [Ensifer sp.]|jgi:hypothetical protein|uniref:hypothetical protein n=1 Tax=Ensifer sp. TaxID=1872086 RepID=UPI002E0F20C2|nr:hypothetical protein [Ensifer sp.]
MFVDNLKRFHANATRRHVCLTIFTSRGKTGTYGASPGARRLSTRLTIAVGHAAAARGQITIHG